MPQNGAALWISVDKEAMLQVRTQQDTFVTNHLDGSLASSR
jgi:hypothetical protein